MSFTENIQYEDILAIIREWKPQLRLALAHEILYSLDTPTASPPKQWKTEQIYGLLKTNAPPPTDEECAEIIAEERWRRLG